MTGVQTCGLPIYAAGHVQADHQQALRADLADGTLDFASHQRAGQHQRPRSRQASHGADGIGRDGTGRDAAPRLALFVMCAGPVE